MLKRYYKLQKLKRARRLRDQIIKTTNEGRAKHLFECYGGMRSITYRSGYSESVKFEMHDGHEYYVSDRYMIKAIAKAAQELCLMYHFGFN